MLHDAHCHFFSDRFFAALAQQRAQHESVADLCQELGWSNPGDAGALADRWATELDLYGVDRAALIASVPGDEESVGTAVARHPSRFVGFFMVNAAMPDAVARTRDALEERRLRGVCLFPAMHHTPLDDDRVQRVVEAAAHSNAAVFVHCGLLSLGVRGKLGLRSQFDLRLGDPLGVARLAATFPKLPFIIPHFGAGLLREAMMAADVCPNIHLDTSSSNSWIRHTPGLTMDDVFATALSVMGPRRILFGTDSSFFPRGWQRSVHDGQRAALDRIGVSADDQALVFGGNFERLFPRAQ